MFISNAYAQAAGASQQGFDLMGLLPMAVILVVFYFMLVRPQQKRAKEAKSMLDALQKGDEVVAGAGIIGRITKLTDNYVTIEIADKVEINLQRQAIQMVLPKGTIKTI